MMERASLGLLPNEFGFMIQSEIAIRPACLFESFLRTFRKQYSDAHIYSIKIFSDLDWDEFSRRLSEFLSFPTSVSHSLNAMLESVSDLSWLSGHYSIFIDISELGKYDFIIFDAIDMLTKGISELNKSPRMKLTMIVFI